MLISDSYRQQNAEIHQKVATWGVTPDGTIGLIRHLLKEEGLTTILDYGCGKGRIGRILPNVQSYDPAIPEFSSGAVPADLVVCAAVLEHIEPDCLDAVLDVLKYLTMKVVLLVIDCAPSSYVLSDGRNAHLIQEPLSWWMPKLVERWKIDSIGVTERNFTFVGKV